MPCSKQSNLLFVNENEWLALDFEIENLSKALILFMKALIFK